MYTELPSCLLDELAVVQHIEVKLHAVEGLPPLHAALHAVPLRSTLHGTLGALTVHLPEAG